MYRLYKANFTTDNNADKKYAVKKFKPSLFALSITDNEKLSLKAKLLRLYFYLITIGGFEIYYVEADEKIVHTSYVLGKCYKFRFMKNGDLEIGPCHTQQSYRGKGIYPLVLNTICSDMSDTNGDVFIFVEENNVASVNGIEKCSFKIDGFVEKSKYLKTYYKVDKGCLSE